MKLINKVRAAGYDVQASMTFPDAPTTCYVSGHGVGLYVRKDEIATWAALLAALKQREEAPVGPDRI